MLPKKDHIWREAYHLKQSGLSWSEVLSSLEGYDASFPALFSGVKHWAKRSGLAWPIQSFPNDSMWALAYDLKSEGMPWVEVIESVGYKGHERQMRFGVKKWARRKKKTWPIPPALDMFTYRLAYAGMVYEDIARLQGVTVGTISNRVRKAVRRGLPRPLPIPVQALRFRQAGWSYKQIADRWSGGDIAKAYRLVRKGKKKVRLNKYE